jgi:hypothetical protein
LTLPPLSESETRNYLRSRLQVAGYRGPDLFSDGVVSTIARLSGGLSRRINILADKTLLAAFGARTHNLSIAHVKAAAQDAEMTPAHSAGNNLRTWGWATAGIFAGLVLLAFIAWKGMRESVSTGQAMHGTLGENLQPAELAAASLPHSKKRTTGKIRATLAHEDTHENNPPGNS